MLNQTVWRYSLRITSLVLFAPALLAQTMTSGDIAGTVTDPAGGALSEAIILLKNNGTGDVQQTKTKAQGAYRFTFLPPGSYTITVQAPNFMTAQKVVLVSVGQVTSVDVQLSIKTASTSIEVSAFAVGVQTDKWQPFHHHYTAAIG